MTVKVARGRCAGWARCWAAAGSPPGPPPPRQVLLIAVSVIVTNVATNILTQLLVEVSFYESSFVRPGAAAWRGPRPGRGPAWLGPPAATAVDAAEARATD